MADIDLKTLTPDTSLPTTGFLFGADSQAAVSPSVYSMQTVATTLLGSTSLTGNTITTDSPVLNLAQTWNAGGVTFTGLKFNATSTASAAASLLMDLQVGSTSKFKVDKDGVLNLGNGSTIITPNYAGATTFQYLNNGLKFLNVTGVYYTGFADSAIGISQNGATAAAGVLTLDVVLRAAGAGSLALGAFNTTGTTAPTPQSLSVQSWASSTNSNQLGANFTIDGSQGTGTGAGGSIIFRVAPAGGTSNGVQNALTTALTINSERNLVIRNGGYIRTEGAQPNSGIRIGGNGLNEPILATEWVNSGSVALSTGRSGAGNSWLAINSTTVFGWGDATNLGTGVPVIDVSLYRDAANTLALRNGTAAQAFRVYNTYDGTNNEWHETIWGANVCYLQTNKTGTGTARQLWVGTSGAADLALYTNGNARWKINGSTGHLLADVDNSYDIGASGATRPRNVYVAGNIGPETNKGINFATNTVYITPSGGTGEYVFLANAFSFGWVAGGTRTLSLTATTGNTNRNSNILQVDASNGTGTGTAGALVIRSAPVGSSGGASHVLEEAVRVAVPSTGVSLLSFSGTTSSFPALKRNATALETKLADDSAYAPHAMQYLDVTDGVTAPASATGRARIYVDTADGDLKVIFADGTVKTIVTDT